MDILLEFCDTYFFDKVYAKLLPLPVGANTTLPILDPQVVGDVYGVARPRYVGASLWAGLSQLPRSNVIRQAISLQLITWLFGVISYLSTASISYYFLYDHDNFKHPRYLKNQVRMEIKQAMTSMPIMAALTVPWFLLECQGYSRLYTEIGEKGWIYFIVQFPLFIFFTDMLVYVAHRWLHLPGVYKHLHKPHHKWLIPTPFASHAFHPVDGYVQSLPYHFFPMVFPLHKIAYMALFAFVNIWSVMIHDGEYLAHDPVINGSACHTIHHLYFNYNYGQYTTLWDRLGGTHRQPDPELFSSKLKKSSATWKKQAKDMDAMRLIVEGADNDRVYVDSTGSSGDTYSTKRPVPTKA